MGVQNAAGKFLSMAKDDRPCVIFVLGGPGAGKGTQCARIQSHFGFQHISAGDCLREERARSDSEVGQMIEEYIREGKIVPVEITCALLRKKIQQHGGKCFLIDGFPRNENNLEGWFKTCGEDVRTAFVLNFVCSDEVMLQRLLARGVSGSGRIDDNLDSAKKRLKTFHEETEPVLQKFSQMGRCVNIPAERPVEDVWADVSALLEQWEESGEVPVLRR